LNGRCVTRRAKSTPTLLASQGRQTADLAVQAPTGYELAINLETHRQQLARVRNVRGSVAVGEQPIVSDATEALRHEVNQEALVEVVGCQHHRL
jgi:hypothetical protein